MHQTPAARNMARATTEERLRAAYVLADMAAVIALRSRAPRRLTDSDAAKIARAARLIFLLTEDVGIVPEVSKLGDIVKQVRASAEDAAEAATDFQIACGAERKAFARLVRERALNLFDTASVFSA